VLTTTEKCPATEVVARGLFCSELGLICPYASACAGIPAYDECQCVGGRTATETAHFECTSACEGSLDAGPSGAPDATSSDAGSLDAGPPSNDGGP
jgi:hypothetical protein